MATLIFSAIGNALLPGLGGVIGGALGALVDTAIFSRTPKVNGPDALRVTGRDEGHPIAWAMGSECPVPGTVLWYGPLKEIKNSGKGGGKVKGGGETSYKVDVALKFLEQTTEEVVKIWAGGELLYDKNADVAVAGTTIAASGVTITRYTFGPDGATPTSVEYYLKLVSSSEAVNLGLLRSGYDAVVAGFTSAVNNGTFRVFSAGRNSDGTSQALLRIPAGGSQATTESAGDSVTIDQDLPEFNQSEVQSITWFPGNGSQVPWSATEAVEGSGNVPAYRGSSYVGLQQLDVTKWGASLPEIRALINVKTGTTLADVVTEICLRTKKLTAADIDVTALTGVAVRGIVSTSPFNGADMLLQLAIAYDLEVQDRGGKLVFFLASAPDEITVPATDYNAVAFGEIPTSRMQRKEIPRTALAKNVSVSFLQPGRGYQVGNADWPWVPEVVPETAKFTLDMVLTRTEAAKISQKLGNRLGLAAEQFETSLPPNYVDVIEADNLLITEVEGEREWRYRVRETDRGDDGRIEVSLIREDLNTFTQVGTGEEPVGIQDVTDVLDLPPNVDFFIGCLPPLRDDDATKVGIYTAVGPSSFSDSFLGATIFRSLDGGSAYSSWQTYFLGTLTGRATTTLSGSASNLFLDTKNTVTVEINNDILTLSSKDLVTVLSGENRVLIGLEIVGFTTATLTAPRTYILSGLVRGMHGTDNRIGSHVTGEPLVFLDEAAPLTFVETGAASLGQTGTYKAVPLGGLLADAYERDLTVQGHSIMPLDPYDIRGSRNVALDITISWKLRTRATYNVISGARPPVMETEEKYEIDIRNAGDTLTRRTIIVTGATSAVYSSANQVTDFGSNQASLVVRIYQISEILGRGRVAVATV